MNDDKSFWHNPPERVINYQTVVMKIIRDKLRSSGQMRPVADFYNGIEIFNFTSSNQRLEKEEMFTSTM